MVHTKTSFVSLYCSGQPSQSMPRVKKEGKEGVRKQRPSERQSFSFSTKKKVVFVSVWFNLQSLSLSECIGIFLVLGCSEKK